MTITGSGFTGTSSVTFAGTPAQSFKVVGDTTITAVTPVAFEAGTAQVAITTPGGVVTGSYAYSARLRPTTARADPSSSDERIPGRTRNNSQRAAEADRASATRTDAGTFISRPGRFALPGGPSIQFSKISGEETFGRRSPEFAATLSKAIARPSAVSRAHAVKVLMALRFIQVMKTPQIEFSFRR